MVDPFSTYALSKTAVGFLSRLGGQELGDQLRTLAQMQRTEVKLLTELQRDMDRLIAEPFVTAGLLLEQAGMPHRSQQEGQRLLQEAQVSLSRALAQDPDPLRLSAACLLLAGVWKALGSPEDEPDLVVTAHQHAITAALALADVVKTPPPPRPRQFWTRMLLAPLPQVPLRGIFSNRPRSLRIGQSYTLSVFSFKYLHVEQSMVTNRARETERMLLAIDGLVRELRAKRIELGELESDVPEYRVHLIPGVSNATKTAGQKMNTVFYALAYTEVSPPQNLPRPARPPSDELPGLQISLLPGRS